MPALAELPELIEKLQARWGRAGNPAFRGLACKLKFSDFSQTTVEQAGTTFDPEQFSRLLRMGHARAERPVRLLGVGVNWRPMKRRHAS